MKLWENSRADKVMDKKLRYKEGSKKDMRADAMAIMKKAFKTKKK